MAGNNLFDDDNLKGGSGKKEHQRMKHFLVYMYLLKNTDNENFATGNDIADYLIGQGIFAERRSIYKDIKELNIALLMLEEETYNTCTFAEAEKMLNEDKELAIIKYKHPNGFYMSRHPIEMEDAKLLAQCIYTARFIPKRLEETLLNNISTYLSYKQSDNIYQDVFKVDRIKTNNQDIINNVEQINIAIKSKVSIEFKYLKYSIQDLKHQIERKHGDKYNVSPYKVVINDGNYYLLCWDENRNKIMTYRVDRMKNVNVLVKSRVENEETKLLMRDIKNYSKRVFSMFGGDKISVDIRFINPLIDTVVDRFGTSGDVYYGKVDDKHFIVRTQIEVSEQFFGWVCGFGNRAKIVSPQSVVDKFNEFIDKIKSIY